MREKCLLDLCFPSVRVEDYQEPKKKGMKDEDKKEEKTLPLVIKKVLIYDDTVYRDALEKYQFEMKNVKRK
jgi:hypothetical protein